MALVRFAVNYFWAFALPRQASTIPLFAHRKLKISNKNKRLEPSDHARGMLNPIAISAGHSIALLYTRT